jgi:hypothetical protein
MFRQMLAWFHAASTKKEKNRRKLYCLLFDQYLGSDHVYHLANKTEACLANLTYRGEQKKCDWSYFNDAHIKLHTIANNLTEHGYSGLDKFPKVRHLLTGIQCNAIQPLVCQILTMREEEKTFSVCVLLFAEFIRHLKSNPSNTLCIELRSALAAVGMAAAAVAVPLVVGVAAALDMGAGASVEATTPAASLPNLRFEVDKVTWNQANKYYTGKEYAVLFPGEKAWIFQNRTDDNKSSPNPSKCRVASLACNEDDLTKSDDYTDLFCDSNNDASASSKCSICSNLNNYVLVCQNKHGN